MRVLRRLSDFLLRYKELLIVFILIIVSFVGMFKFVFPVNVNNLGGMHSWLSGSTIKFVNSWLDEGAANLHFTDYENPASVEFETPESREPYLSYPTGQTMFVFLSAKMIGKNQIGPTYLHKFQLVMFLVSSLLMACFVYFFVERTLKRKKNFEKAFCAYFVSLLWMALPTCAYYLTNVYFADQCVLLWAMGLILVEYLFRTSSSKKQKKWLAVARCIIIYTGVLIDYYFWFLAFLLFAAELVNALMQKKDKKEKKKEAWAVVAWFGIPAVLAVLTYLIQVMQTNGFVEIIKIKLNERVAGGDMLFGDIMHNVGNNFASSFSIDKNMINYLLVLMILMIVLGFYVVKKKKFEILVKNPGVSIVFCNIMAVILQIYFFKQHSAIHEFSMMKVGWIVAMMPIMISMLAGYYLKYLGVREDKKTSKNIISPFITSFCVGYTIIVFVTGVPTSTFNFMSTRLSIEDYSMEEVVKGNTDYYDVVYSFTEEIPYNPPQSLAMSKKRVYKVSNVEGIVKKQESISSKEAKPVLLINKEGGIDKKTESYQKCLEKGGTVRYSDDKYSIIEIKEINKCLKVQ